MLCRPLPGESLLIRASLLWPLSIKDADLAEHPAEFVLVLTETLAQVVDRNALKEIWGGVVLLAQTRGYDGAVNAVNAASNPDVVIQRNQI